MSALLGPTYILYQYYQYISSFRGGIYHIVFSSMSQASLQTEEAFTLKWYKHTRTHTHTHTHTLTHTHTRVDRSTTFMHLTLVRKKDVLFKKQEMYA